MKAHESAAHSWAHPTNLNRTTYPMQSADTGTGHLQYIQASSLAAAGPASQTSNTPYHEQVQTQYNLHPCHHKSNAGHGMSTTLTANQIGAAFALQYFKIMKTDPEELPRFYGQESQISRISLSSTSEAMEFQIAVGNQQITDLLYKEHARGPPLGKAIISLMECQETVAGGVFMQLSGSLVYANETSREFTMSILLLRQNCSSGLGYYILNDVLVLHQQKLLANHPNYIQCHSDSHQSRLTTQKSVPSQNQALPNEHLTLKHEKPIQPNETSHASHVAPPASTKNSVASPASVQSSMPQQLQSTGMPNKEYQQQPAQTQQVKLETPQTSEDQYASHSSEELVASSMLNNSQNHLSNTQQQEEVLIQSSDEEEEEVNDNVKQVAAHSSETAKKSSVQASQPEPAKVSGTQQPIRELAPPLPQYSKNSYAGALLLSGAFPPSCRKGYSIPGPDQTKPTDESSAHSNKASQATALNQRSKTLRISPMPQDMTNEKIKKAVAEQLKGQCAEGHVVRIERVTNAQHGFLELDTEMCAKVLVTHGLHLQGRQVQTSLVTSTRPRHDRPRREPGSNPRRLPSRTTAPQEGVKVPATEKGWLPAGTKRRTRQQAPKDATTKRYPATTYRPRKVNEEQSMSIVQPVNS